MLINVMEVSVLFSHMYQDDIILKIRFLSDNNQSDIIEALNSTSRYLDDLLNC